MCVPQILYVVIVRVFQVVNAISCLLEYEYTIKWTLDVMWAKSKTEWSACTSEVSICNRSMATGCCDVYIFGSKWKSAYRHRFPFSDRFFQLFSYVMQRRKRFLQPGVSSEADVGRRAERILEPSFNPTFLDGADIGNRIVTAAWGGRVALSHGHGCLSTRVDWLHDQKHLQERECLGASMAHFWCGSEQSQLLDKETNLSCFYWGFDRFRSLSLTRCWYDSVGKVTVGKHHVLVGRVVAATWEDSGESRPPSSVFLPKWQVLLVG